MAGLVHWHEGQFLHPHHFQVLQSQIMEQVAAERKLSKPYTTGVIEIDYSNDALANHQVRFSRLRLVMPSGLLVDFPNNTDLPPLLDIKQAFEESGGSLTISIGVPVWSATRGNTIDPNNGQDSCAKRIYKIVDSHQADENNGDNEQTVLMRKINARLLIDGDDDTEMEVVPLLKLTSSGGDDLGLPRVDPAYIPPCRVVSASPTLMTMVRDVSHQVAAARKETMVQLTRGGFSPETIRGVQFLQMLRFKTLSRFSALLPQLIKVREISPYDIYLYLVELLGEISALDPTRDQLDSIDYEPNQLGLVFRDLTARITSLLKKVEDDGSYLMVPFQVRDNVQVAELSPEHFTGASEFYLAVQSRDDLQQVVKLVKNQKEFRLTTLEKSKMRIYGLELAFEQNPPLQLPAQVGMLYFRIQTVSNTTIWDEVKKDAMLAAWWPSMDTTDYKLKLYIMQTSA